jgi:hypothetical protein
MISSFDARRAPLPIDDDRARAIADRKTGSAVTS